MKKYKIEFSETVLRLVNIEINANSEEEAKEKIICGNFYEKDAIIKDLDTTSVNIISINEIKK